MQNRAKSFLRLQNLLARFCELKPTKETTVIVVAGTNGKGSTSKALEHLFLSVNKSVGLFTSPHLFQINERIRVNGADMTDEQLVQGYLRWQKTFDEFGFSHFEVLAWLAFDCFFAMQRPGLDVVILEVGVGGLFDPANLHEHQISVLTPIDFDHVKVLGGSLPEIAGHKWGIVKPGQIVVHEDWPLSLKLPWLEQCKKWDSTVTLLKRKSWKSGIGKSGDPRPTMTGPWGEATLQMYGRRSIENMERALTVFESLGGDLTQVKSALESWFWPGRFEQLIVCKSKARVFVSGDHNVNGIESLQDLLRDFIYERIYFICGVSAHKDRQQIESKLVQTEGAELIRVAPAFGSDVGLGTWQEALRDTSARATNRDLIVITGSLYLAGEVLQHFRSQNLGGEKPFLNK